MTPDQALAAIADDARNYADPERALWLARQRVRRRLLGASLAVAALVGAVVVAPQLWRHHTGAPASPASATSTSTAPPDHRATTGPYPTRVGPPAQTPPPLPANRAVGPAAFLYAIANSPLLVTIDGTQYRLPEPALFNTGLTSLSPDGRWLHSGTTLRELTSTVSHQVPRGRTRWSPQARWALISDDNATNQQLVEVATGRTTTVGSAVAVLDTGDLVVATDTDAKKTTLTITNPRTGAALHHVTVNATGVLTGDQSIAGRAGDNPPALRRIWPDRDDRAFLEVEGSSTLMLLTVSLTDGTILGRLTVPAEQPPYQLWATAGVDTGKIVLRHQPTAGTLPTRGPAAPEQVYQLAFAEPTGGSPRVVCEIPAHAMVLARGSDVPLA